MCSEDGTKCNDCETKGTGCPSTVTVVGEDLAAHLKPSLEAAGHKVLVVDDQLAAERLALQKGEPAQATDGAVYHTESIDRAEREERPLTMDEARAQVCRSTAAMLASSVQATLAELEKAKAAGQDGVQEETGRRIVQAARELGAQLIAQARKLDRPRILRPDRRLRVVPPRGRMILRPDRRLRVVPPRGRMS